MVSAGEVDRLLRKAIDKMLLFIAEVVYSDMIDAMCPIQKSANLVTRISVENLSALSWETHGNDTRRHIGEVKIKTIPHVAVPLFRSDSPYTSEYATTTTTSAWTG